MKIRVKTVKDALAGFEHYARRADMSHREFLHRHGAYNFRIMDGWSARIRSDEEVQNMTYREGHIYLDCSTGDVMMEVPDDNDTRA